MKYIVFTDGGSRGNPGPAGCGIFITDRAGIGIEKRYKYLGVTTNNIAEYTAGLLGITRAIELGSSEIELRADSQLMIEQLSGRYKVKHPGLREIYLEIQSRLSDWGGKITFTHIPRELNKEADRLSNVAMDVGMRASV